MIYGIAENPRPAGKLVKQAPASEGLNSRKLMSLRWATEEAAL